MGACSGGEGERGVAVSWEPVRPVAASEHRPPPLPPRGPPHPAARLRPRSWLQPRVDLR